MTKGGCAKGRRNVMEAPDILRLRHMATGMHTRRPTTTVDISDHTTDTDSARISISGTVAASAAAGSSISVGQAAGLPYGVWSDAKIISTSPCAMISSKRSSSSL